MTSKTHLFLFACALSATSFPPTLKGYPATFQLAQMTPSPFNAWRPHKNPNKMVQVGMNKGQVLAAAGSPDREEFYYQELAGRGLVAISDWYYIRSGFNPEITRLKFVGDSLVSLETMPGP